MPHNTPPPQAMPGSYTPMDHVKEQLSTMLSKKMGGSSMEYEPPPPQYNASPQFQPGRIPAGQGYMSQPPSYGVPQGSATPQGQFRKLYLAKA